MERHPGRVARMGQDQFLLFPCLDEPSFLRERKVILGMEGGPGLHNAIVGCSQLAARRGSEQSLCLSADKGSRFPAAAERRQAQGCAKCPLVSLGHPWKSPCPTVAGVGSAAYPVLCQIEVLLLRDCLNGGFLAEPCLYCFLCVSAGKESAL